MVGYTKGGKVVAHDSSDCYARRTETDEPLYYIRTERAQGGGLYDPLSSFSSNRPSAKINGMWDKYPFVTVTKDTFDLYVQYLKTSNNAYLINANRSHRSAQ